MKKVVKILLTSIATLAILVFVGCDNLPKQTPMEYMNKVAEENNSVVQNKFLMNISSKLSSDSDTTPEERELENEFAATIKMKPISEEISEDGKTAKVKVEYEFADVGKLQADIIKEMSENTNIVSMSEEEFLKECFVKMKGKVTDYLTEPLKVEQEIELEQDLATWKEVNEDENFNEFIKLRDEAIEKSFMEYLK